MDKPNNYASVKTSKFQNLREKIGKSDTYIFQKTQQRYPLLLAVGYAWFT
jgi:hypothetical protein